MFKETRQIKTRRIVQLIEQGLLTVTNAELHIARKCNLRCHFCGLADNRDLGLNGIPDPRWLKIADELIGMGVREWRLGGGLGEIMCHDELVMTLARKIKKNNGFGSFITNGSLFSVHQIEEIIDIGWDRVDFSLDGADAQTHDFLRGCNGVFDKLITAISTFRALLDKRNGSTFINISCVLMRDNFRALPEITKLAGALGVNDIHFELIKPVNSFAQQQQVSSEHRDELTLLVQHAQTICKSHQLRSNLDALLSSLTDEQKSDQVALPVNSIVQPLWYAKLLANAFRVRTSGVKKAFTPLWRLLPRHWRYTTFRHLNCFEPFQTITIQRDGVITPCCLLRIGAHYDPHKSLERIWYGSYFSRFRYQFLSGIIPKVCAGCWQSQQLKSESFRRELDYYRD